MSLMSLNVTFYVTFYHTSKLELLFEVWELRSAALCGAEVWLCEAVPLMRHVCREVIAANSGLVAEKRGASANFSNVSKLRKKNQHNSKGLVIKTHIFSKVNLVKFEVAGS